MSWREHALCAQVGGDLWHPEKGQSNVEAKRICNSCPVIDACLEYALRYPEMGIWGGLSESQRDRIRKERGIRFLSGQVKCGTEAGARAHYRRDEKPCPRCMEAQLLYGRERRLARRSS